MKKHFLHAAVATLTLEAFLLASCSNSIDGISTGTGGDTADSAQGSSSGNTAANGSSLITFTGNPAYDITLLNEYWTKNGTTFSVTAGDSTSGTASESRAIVADSISGPLLNAGDAAINGFGDLVKNFSGMNLLTWAGGTALSGMISGAVGSLVSMGITELFDALGLVKSTESYLAEISDKLDKIQDQLNTMQTMLSEMETKLYTETQYQAELTRYYSVMQNRDIQYGNIYIDALVCWNSITDVLVDAALSSQYSTESEKSAKLAELNTKAKRLAYLKRFIDSDSWDTATDIDDVSVVQSSAGTAFETYFTEHAAEISAEIQEIVKNWGENSTGASSVFKLCKYLTDTNKGLASDSFNMFELYDKYAEVCFVWEQEGYNWRQQMRDQDCALIAITAPLAFRYYALTEKLGTGSTNCLQLAGYVESAITVCKNNPVVRHSTPVYQKWGSQWRGQAFTGEIKQIDYTKLLKEKWTTNTEAEATICRIDSSPYWLAYKWNSSRFYAGLEPQSPWSWTQNEKICSEAATLAMPEAWYKEQFEAYVSSSASGMTHKALIEIFRNAGFTYTDGTSLIYSPVNEQYFITSQKNYARIVIGYSAGYWHEYCPYIPVVTANSRSACIVSTHESCPVVFQGVHYWCWIGNSKENVSDDIAESRQVLTNWSNKTYFYPVKTDTVVEAQ
ncbi:MAG: hypothetical protein K6G80_11115 [Treponema sp.]|nr:hypothetical protein [Treponema sp.]